jgi:hypothetical protein
VHKYAVGGSRLSWAWCRVAARPLKVTSAAGPVVSGV